MPQLFMQRAAGTYALLLHNPKSQTLSIGRWQTLTFSAGYYLYIGSAFGPGGVQARVLRHRQRNKKLRWHIDYLSTQWAVRGAWYSHSPKRLEHDWANTLQALPNLSPIEGFGCSDCDCQSHLFYGQRKRDFYPVMQSSPDIQWQSLRDFFHQES